MKKKWLMIALIVTILILGGSTYYFYSKYYEAKKQMINPQQLVDQQGAEIVSKVSLLMDLPNEAPTIATVLDASKLQDQVFFKNAKNDDRVLIYTQAKKAVLYRPSTNKIIEVSPLNLGEDISVSPTPTQKNTVVKEAVEESINSEEL